MVRSGYCEKCCEFAEERRLFYVALTRTKNRVYLLFDKNPNYRSEFIKEIDRVLKDSGHLFLWVDKFHLCQGVLNWFTETKLNLVDMIVWDKGKIGMGYRTRRRSEYLIVLQKSPVRVKGCWNDHDIPDRRQ